MFGSKKPTEFDAAQDKQLQQLMRNQKILIENNAYFIKQNKNLWTWVKWLESHVKSLEGRMAANEKRDAQFSELFSNLSAVSSKKSVEVQPGNVETVTAP